MTVVWKRLIDQNDPTRDPMMRFKLAGDCFWVLKKDFDQNAMWMLNARSGDVVWHTDPKKPNESAPMYGPVFSSGVVYGLMVTDANTWRVSGYAAQTGTKVCQYESKPFAVKPEVELDQRIRGKYLLVRIADQQEFSLILFDTEKKQPVHALALKGMGPYGVHGRVSYTAQGGYLAMLTKTQLIIDGPK